MNWTTLGKLAKAIAPFVPLGTTYMGGRQTQSAANTAAAQAQRAAEMAYQQQMAILAEQRRQSEEQMAQLKAQFEAQQLNTAAQMAEQQRMNQATLGMSQERLAMDKAAVADALAERERRSARATPFREATLAYLAKPVEPFRPSIGLYRRPS
jgi:flagellar biosynthesis GTPase FlhF